MVNILVPTDFSDLSKIAVKYALEISNQLGGNVTLLHVIDFGETLKATIRLQTNSREVVRNIKDNFQQLIDEVGADVPIWQPIVCEIAKGRSFEGTVIKESKRLKSGLIVMGTKGATGLRKAVIGSNTATMIAESSIPVLAVPEDAQIRTLRNIVYATDLKNLKEELATLMPYAKQFDCTVHVLHIVDEGEDIEVAEERINTIIKESGYGNIVPLVTFNPDIDEAIEQYISVSNADMLAMFTHEPTFYERVFDKSMTRKMAFHSKVPLLAFKNSTK